MTWPSPERFLLNKTEVASVLGVTAGLLAGHWTLRDSSMEEAIGRLPWWIRAAVLGTLIFCLTLAPGDNRAFIYFQF